MNVSVNHVQVITEYIPPDTPSHLRIEERIFPWKFIRVHGETHHSCYVGHFTNLQRINENGLKERLVEC